MGLSSHAMMSGNSSAQQQVLGRPSHAMRSGGSFAQWQVLVGSLLLVSDVLYGKARGSGMWIWLAKDNPTNGGGNSIYVC